MRTGRPPIPIEDRFWPRVNKTGTSGCWLWEGTFVRGYGVIWLRKKYWKAHRVSWVLSNGEIPNGLFVCHKCDNPRCVNPGHLFLGTARDNAMDATTKGRNSRGSRHGGSVLVEDDIAEVFILRAAGWNTREISERLGVSDVHVGRILNGAAWRHLWL